MPDRMGLCAFYWLKMVLYIKTAIVASIFMIGAASGYIAQAWRYDAADADRMRAEQTAATAREATARQQRFDADQAAAQHAATLAQLNTKLGDARAHIARLSDRQCLGAGTVRMLNGIGASGLGVRAPAANLAGAPTAPATPAPDDGYSTERDTADHIATCRASYAAVSDQLNRILDIEDKRSPPGAQRPPARCMPSFVQTPTL